MYFDSIVLILQACYVFGNFKHEYFVYKGDIPYSDGLSALQELTLHKNTDKMIYCSLQCQRKTDCKAVTLCSKDDEDVCILRSKCLSNMTNDIGDVCKYMDSIAVEKIEDMASQGWIYHECAFYYISQEKQNWKKARLSCMKKDAKLAAIETESENEFLRQHLLEQYDKNGYNYWLGGSDILKEDIWIWDSTGLNMTFTDWGHAPGWNPEPNGGRRENCLSLRRDENFHWNDDRCKKAYFFICERNE